MKTESIHQIKKELLALEPHELTELCLKLAKYRKENKEFLTYLLYDQKNEGQYIESIQNLIDESFDEIGKTNVYIETKQIRKLLKKLYKFLKFSNTPSTSVEVLIYFCEKYKPIVLKRQVLAVDKIYSIQLKKITLNFDKLHEDLQFDYKKRITNLYF